jgi:hypothetical protein
MGSAANALKIAAAQIGVVERPAESNCTKFSAWYGMGCSPWCAMFCSWTLDQSGDAAANGGKFAYCPYWENYFRSQGRWFTDHSQARPGDLIFYSFGGKRSDHVGFVEKPLSGAQQTIEGNTSAGAGSQNNGDGVWRRARTYGPVRGYGRVIYSGVVPKPPEEDPVPEYKSINGGMTTPQKIWGDAQWYYVFLGDDKAISLVSGDMLADPTVTLGVAGLPEGEVVQVRLVSDTVDSSGKVTAQAKGPIVEIAGSAGTSFGQFGHPVDLNTSDRLRIMMAAWQEVTVEKVSARILYWEE